MPARIRLRTGRGTRRVPGVMNRSEADYAAWLEGQRLAGFVLEWHFERIKLKLADKTWYSPDFLVMLADGVIELVDVKGTKKKPNGETGYWAEEDSKIKLRVVAELFPFKFRVAFKDKQLGWQHEEVGPQ